MSGNCCGNGIVIWQGTFFGLTFTMTDCDGNPIPITDWQFQAQFRLDTEEPVLLELTSAAGEFVVYDGPKGVFFMQIQPTDTALLPADETLRFDVMRTAPEPTPIMLFWGKVPVKQPVTHT